MRQGTGTDVLGLNDPRNAHNASIGVIYVSANDENSSVIKAIQGQAKLGRKQVAVVLSEQHKAFQHPEDFDELKRIRSSLQVEVVFIAPGGPGPAEFARQRRFLVYSSLENYTKALHDEQATRKSKETRRGWFFGRKPETVVSEAETSPELATASPTQAPVPSPEVHEDTTDIVEETDSKAPLSRIRPIIIGGAETSIVVPATANVQKEDSASVASVASVSSALSPSTDIPHVTTTQTGESDEVTSGPAIIDLRSTRSRSKETVKLSSVHVDAPDIMLPVAVGASPMQAASDTVIHSVPRASTNRISGQSGKVVAVGATATMSASGANAGNSAGSNVRRSSKRRAGNALASASLANTATGGSPPPTLNRGGSGGGGGGGGRRGAVILGLVALIVLTGGVVSAIAYSQPGLLSPLKNIVKLQGQSTVTITPASKTESGSYVVIGVQGTPDASKQQVSARTITGTSPSQSKTVAATGQKQTPGVAATGTLTFKNGLFRSQTVTTRIFTGKDGVSVTLNGSVTIPATNPNTGIIGSITVPAHAVNVGQIGDINASDISQSCCTADNSIYVVNNSAFTGGQDPQNYTFVQQSDIDSVVNALEPSLLQQAQNSLKGQVHSNEQLAGSDTCTPSEMHNQNAGNRASSVTVTVSVTCKGIAYDQKGALALVTNLLSQKASSDLGSNYALVGNIVTTSKVQNVTQSGVSLLLSAKGVWVYQFSASQQQNLKNLIAGKSVSDAITLLKSQTGVSDVSINPTSGTLPTNASDITIVIQPISGLSGGGSSGGTSVTPTVTGPGTSPTSQTGNG